MTVVFRCPKCWALFRMAKFPSHDAVCKSAIFDPDEDFLTLADAIFDACCAMKAEERAAEEWESDYLIRQYYDLRDAPG